MDVSGNFHGRISKKSNIMAGPAFLVLTRFRDGAGQITAIIRVRRAVHDTVNTVVVRHMLESFVKVHVMLPRQTHGISLKTIRRAPTVVVPHIKGNQ